MTVYCLRMRIYYRYQSAHASKLKCFIREGDVISPPHMDADASSRCNDTDEEPYFISRKALAWNAYLVFHYITNGAPSANHH